jgi:hypothetical protein
LSTDPNLAKAVRPINYLRKLLAAPVDFGYALRAKAAEQARAALVAAEQRNADAFVRAAIGKVFVDTAGLRQCVVEDGGRTLATTELAEGVVRRSVSGWQVGFMESVQQGQLHTVSAHELAQHRDTAKVLRARAAKRETARDMPGLSALHEPARTPQGACAPSPSPVTRMHEVHPCRQQNDPPRSLTRTAAEALAALRAMRKLPARSPV